MKVEEGLSDARIAELTGRDRNTIARVCDDANPEFQQFRDLIGAKRVESIKHRLRLKAPEMLDRWEAAAEQAC